MFCISNVNIGAANRAELREQVARQEREIALLKAKVAEGGHEDGEGGSRSEVLEVNDEASRCGTMGSCPASLSCFVVSLSGNGYL